MMRLVLLVAWIIIKTEAVFKECVTCSNVSSDSCKYDQCCQTEGERCGGLMNLWGNCRSGQECMYRKGSVFNEERFGFCEDVKCSNVRCGYRQRCVMISTDGVMVPSCVCPSYCCDGENDHVCDYNGMTYSSVCELLRTECMKGIYFGIKQCEKNSITVNQQLTTEPIGWNIKPVTITKCSYNGNIYLPGDGVDHDDSCINASCTASGRVLFVPIPGCGDNEPEIDYKVNYPSFNTQCNCNNSNYEES